MTPAPTPQPAKDKTRELIVAVKNLETSEHWQRLRDFLFDMAPPLGDTFWARDEHNPHAAAKRDGMQKITRTIKQLIDAEEPKDPAPIEIKAEFKGDAKP